MARLHCIANCIEDGMAPCDALARMEKAVGAGADWISIGIDERTVGLVMQTVEGGPNDNFIVKAMRIAEGRTGLNIDVSGAPAVKYVVREIHNAIFRRTWKYAHFMVSSRDFTCLRLAQSYDPNIRLGCVVLGAPRVTAEYAARMGTQAVFINKSHITSSLVEHCRGLDLEIMVRDINSEEEYLLMESLEVNGIVTDFPGSVAKWRLPRYRGKNLAVY